MNREFVNFTHFRTQKISTLPHLHLYFLVPSSLYNVGVVGSEHFGRSTGRSVKTACHQKAAGPKESVKPPNGREKDGLEIVEGMKEISRSGEFMYVYICIYIYMCIQDIYIYSPHSG